MLSHHNVEQLQDQVFPSAGISGILGSEQQQDVSAYPPYKELVPLVLVVLKLCFNGKADKKRQLICEKVVNFYKLENLDTCNWDNNKILGLIEQARQFAVHKKYMYNTSQTPRGHGGYGVWELAWHGMRKATNWVKANSEHPWLKSLIQPTVILDELQQAETFTDESPGEPELDQKFNRMFREKEILEWIILAVWKKGGKGVKKLLVNELADTANLSEKMQSFRYAGPGGSALATSTIFGNSLRYLREKYGLVDQPGGGVVKLTPKGAIAGELLMERGLSRQPWMRPPGRTDNQERWMNLMGEVELLYNQNFVSVTEEVVDQTQEETPIASHVTDALDLGIQRQILVDSLFSWKRVFDSQVIDQMINCLFGNIDHTKDGRIVELERQVASLEHQLASKDKIISRWESIGNQVDTIRGEGKGS